MVVVFFLDPIGSQGTMNLKTSIYSDGSKLWLTLVLCHPYMHSSSHRRSLSTTSLASVMTFDLRFQYFGRALMVRPRAGGHNLTEILSVDPWF